MPEDDVRRTVGFKTQGDWTARDLEDFAAGLGAIYDALLTIRIKRGFDETSLELARRSLRDLEEFAPGPFAHELLYTWRRALEAWERRGIAPPFLPAGYGFPFTIGPSAQAPTDQAVFEHLDVYASDEQRLRLRRAQMSSPGGFNFEGLGDIIEQLRELIKDLWYRNRQDRIEGDLKIIERILTLQEGHPDANIQLPRSVEKRLYLIEKTADGVAKLKRLEAVRKLLPPPENLDYEPPRSAA